MWENVKIGLFLVALVVVFFLLAPHLPNIWGTTADRSQINVEYATAVQGRIGGSYVSRQYHRYYLDGNPEQYYDFNGFTQPLTPAQRQLTEDEQNTLGLGRRLETGDIVSKAANSTLLTVQRDDSISRWFCATPEEIEQAQKAAR